MIDGYKLYLTVGMFEDGTPGEIFVRISKRGSPLHGLLDDFAIAVSWGLQYGVPLEKLCDKFVGRSYEPSGRTNNPAIPEATSVVDYIARWMRLKFLKAEESNPGLAKTG